MFNHNWWTSLLPLLIWFLTTHLDLGIGQSQNAIGAHRAYQKTSFSCAGRPSGYYADIETGCQVYHMCDGLGRQFSYSCPNTTLFQQRMLICDHWYMVNCSRSESNYAANLLIGQRDKPFVNDEENSLRTPRPDLLDRPYAPDYSGESFRNQYKQLPAVQNQIIDSNAQKNSDKTTAESQLAPGQTRWKIPPPSRTILPPAYEPQTATESSNNAAKTTAGSAVRFIARESTVRTTPAFSRTPYTTARTTTTTTATPRASTTSRRPTSPAAAPTRRQPQPEPQSQSQHIGNNRNSALHQRQPQLEPRVIASVDHDDLGTSHSTRYNTSADFNSAEARIPQKSGSALGRAKAAKSYSGTVSNKFSTTASFTTSTTTTTTRTTKSPIKVPSKIYEPPFLYPIYNLNDTADSSSIVGSSTTTARPLRVSSATPFTAAPTKQTTRTTATPTISSTSTRPITRPTTLAGKPFSATAASPVQRTAASPTPHSLFDAEKLLKDATRTPTPAQGFKPPTPRPPLNSPKTLTSSATKSTHSVVPELPSNELLPPLQDFVQHDIATTQGPPIYYEWKLPSNGLEPPKLEAPIGVDGREYPESTVDYNIISAAAAAKKGGADQQKSAASVSVKSSYANNPFLAAAVATATKTQRSVAQSLSERTPTSRSIKETGQPNSVASKSSKTSKSTGADAADPKPSDLNELRKTLSVPEYSFPLENIGRTGYLSSDTYNSFQLKIPQRRSDNDAEQLHWFGENPKCPECHPSYVKPGTCEPCLRR